MTCSIDGKCISHADPHVSAILCMWGTQYCTYPTATVVSGNTNSFSVRTSAADVLHTSGKRVVLVNRKGDGERYGGDDRESYSEIVTALMIASALTRSPLLFGG